VFLSYHDGWPHFYSVALTGGKARLLTPGGFMVEDVALTPDRRSIVYNANTGADPDDGERRHLFRVALDAGRPVQITKGKGIEWDPVITADGKTLAYLGSDAVRPPQPTILPLDGGGARALAEPLPDFPASDIVRPEPVVLETRPGLKVHAQLFRGHTPVRGPGIVFLHGGPAQQMLLGWHYDDYYAHAYAVNQYLASLGYLVLSVNYRLGIGYGHAFQFPEPAGTAGAPEYDDVIAAGEYLQSRPDVDGTRIGIWGLSYGGYLTSLALGRASNLFSAGVDVHGIHDSVVSQVANFKPAGSEEGAGPPRWRSPVLLIHADDDRNVPFGETVDFERTLIARGVPVESRVIPDDVHDFLLFRSWTRVATATAEFFERTLLHPAPDALPK
jgi:dipeptidyl aminopeptidase/acylaminoacyl peptidase